MVRADGEAAVEAYIPEGLQVRNCAGLLQSASEGAACVLLARPAAAAYALAGLPAEGAVAEEFRVLPADNRTRLRRHGCG